MAFRNLAYTGGNDDGGGTSLARTAEGYVEVFEMATYTLTSVTGHNSKHDPTTGVPLDCSKVTGRHRPRSKRSRFQAACSAA